MITYMIVENDEYELPVKCGLKTSKEVGEYLGVCENTVRSRIFKGWKTGKYKIIKMDDKKRVDSKKYGKSYRKRVYRSQYFREWYLKNKAKGEQENVSI